MKNVPRISNNQANISREVKPCNAAANAFGEHTPKDFFENEIYSDKPFLSRFVLESELF